MLAVSHGGPSRWLLCHLLGVPLRRSRIFRHDQGRFHVLVVDDQLSLTKTIALNTAEPPEWGDPPRSHDDTLGTSSMGNATP
ncbi:histidine phosphatase family protein [Streptomyces sp. NPDC006711]|uniref:histidine phosphatase family protein n=1 Tax=Streptomyces sp. NPDC006711 TaxID=3364762 RepID=UPI0036931AAB